MGGMDKITRLANLELAYYRERLETQQRELKAAQARHERAQADVDETEEAIRQLESELELLGESSVAVPA